MDNDFFLLHALCYLSDLVMRNVMAQELPHYPESQGNADKSDHANHHQLSYSHECSIPENPIAVRGDLHVVLPFSAEGKP